MVRWLLAHVQGYRPSGRGRCRGHGRRRRRRPGRSRAPAGARGAGPRPPDARDRGRSRRHHRRRRRGRHRRARRCHGAAVRRRSRGRGHRVAAAPPPRARRRRALPGRDADGRASRHRRERPHPRACDARARVAGHSSLRAPPLFASRWAALGAARLRPERATHAGGQSWPRAPGRPPLSFARAPAGGRRMSGSRTRWDVIVVGAGPAGAATAILLAERGLEVLVLDRARLPRPKICGEYLSPEAARVLDRLGVLKSVDAAGAVPLSGMTITAPDGTVVTGTYGPIGPWRPYRDHAMAVSRAVLDGALVERLRTLPVDFREQTRVSDLLRDADRVVGVEAMDAGGGLHVFRAPLVIGADGRASVVAQRLGCRRAHPLQRMAIVTYVEGVAGCTERGEIFVDPPDYAILNPIAPDRTNLSVVVPLAHAAPWSNRLEAFLDARVKQLPHLARRLAGTARIAPVQALGPLAYAVRPPRAGGALLVGDAAGFYDPLTGEGVFSALRGAELAAEPAARTLRAGDCSAAALAAYTRARHATFAGKARVTRALQMIVRRRPLANLTARVLVRRPALLGLVMGVVGDYVPPRALVGGLLAR